MKYERSIVQSHAETPDHVARVILAGIRDNRYMVFTSRDIAVGYFFQRKFALPYELVMRGMNKSLGAAVGYGRK